MNKDIDKEMEKDIKDNNENIIDKDKDDILYE